MGIFDRTYHMSLNLIIFFPVKEYKCLCFDYDQFVLDISARRKTRTQNAQVQIQSFD
jgi:hypothetical protein